VNCGERGNNEGIINYIQDPLSKSYSMNSPGPGDLQGSRPGIEKAEADLGASIRVKMIGYPVRVGAVESAKEHCDGRFPVGLFQMPIRARIDTLFGAMMAGVW
jgi:hypothetical protein